ncbi:ribonuclease HII [Chromobacterium subtsugae]|uniref:Ribonuclease HII n=1 Tax=Chromobacterium subtsugae TaxID=251747 RepID=A0ABS7FCY6_9NEIS|nr:MULTISPECIES: ribonuclease HII [Chromobacterium]MBW7565608.1 ribonuclease HII [Chromobacterium subtsugae]MBW8287939.1 ribonuclease HII [Chromobacterium subtsugae]WSE89705.1 ribonuclease HII [Chromobacterium subtsugae]WVH58076.1 ribonuclease HII [Chromobacterium subtsugae]
MPLICGVDEAGRGPLAGAVFAAAVILDPAKPIAGLADSKVLSEAKRDALAAWIKRDALAWCIASASVEEIDKLNILHATMLAMTRAVEGLSTRPDLAQIDGNRVPKHLPVPGEAIVKGDAKVAAISAASILAKTARDAELVALDARHPQYGFARHKGYPTAEHLAAIERHGVLAEHRKTFGPVRSWLASHQGQLF